MTGGAGSRSRRPRPHRRLLQRRCLTPTPSAPTPPGGSRSTSAPGTARSATGSWRPTAHRRLLRAALRAAQGAPRRPAPGLPALDRARRRALRPLARRGVLPRSPAAPSKVSWKRFFRDRTWSIRPPAGCRSCTSPCAGRRRRWPDPGRSPTVRELAASPRCPRTTSWEALEASGAHQGGQPRPGPHRRQRGRGASLGDRVLTSDEGGYDHIDRRDLIQGCSRTSPSGTARSSRCGSSRT